MSSSKLASLLLVIRYGFCLNRDVSIFLFELFELLLPNTFIGNFMFMKLIQVDVLFKNTFLKWYHKIHSFN